MPQDAPVKADGLPYSGPRPACPDLPTDNIPLAIEGVEDLQEPLDQGEQTGDINWDEEPERLRQEREDTKLTLSADSERTYLMQIRKVALLTAEQEVQLAKRIEAGLYAAQRLRRAEDSTEKLFPQLRQDLAWIARDGQRAKHHLVEANLRLVVAVAKRYTGRGMPFLDLIQEGNVGLIHAVEKFDYTQVYKFSTYAIWWIRQAITRALAEQGRTIRIPRYLAEVINKLCSLQRELLQHLGREPSAAELATKMDITPQKVRQLRQYTRQPLSLDQTLGEEDACPLGDLIEDSQAVIPADAVLFVQLHDDLQALLTTLSKREASIIRLRYGLTDGHPRTLDAIGRMYGLTRERIRQIEATTMTKLRQPSRCQALRDYLCS